jgi:hypothetical protein
MTAITNERPELRNVSSCQSCGEPIGWVTLKPGHLRRPVDPDPLPLAEYALLRDGVTAVNLRSPDVDDRFEQYNGPRFWDHQKTCPVPSMTTARAALERGLGYEADPYREEQRRRLLAAGRSPWAKRAPGV